MANTPQDDRFYKSHTLLKWFGISSIVMLVFTIWMLLDDFGRDWKAYQDEFFVLRQKKYDEWIAKAKGEVDENKIKQEQEGLADAAKQIAQHEAEIENLNKQLIQLKTKEKLATVKYQAEKGVWDVEKYQYEAKYGHHVAEGEELSEKGTKEKEALEKHWDYVQSLNNLMNASTQQVTAVQGKLDEVFANKSRLEKELKVTRANLDRLLDSKNQTELTLSKLLRSAPIIDMANPTFRLQQIVLPTIRDDIYFQKVQKVDRCMTCHMAIDLPGYENEKQPFRTHPRLDVMLGSRSPHPLESIGCTVCHGGNGQRTNFVRAAHTPRNHEQEQDWKKKYGWHEQHYELSKMLPLQYVEGSCRVCHRQTDYVPKAMKLNTSVQLVKFAGCNGCHRIEGWDHVRKLAPSLERVKGKLSRDWIVKWVRNPKSFNDHARMPAVFHQDNQKTAEFAEYNEAEIHAIADFLIQNSDSYSPDQKGGPGNVEHGKQLVGTLGCLGCHQVNDFGQARGRWTAAPDLSTVGSKVSSEWLNSWLKNPRHYWEGTIMPSLRLDDSEIRDIAAYLLTKRNPEFESAQTGTADPEVQKKVLKLYYLRDPKMAPVTNDKVDKAIAALTPHEVSQKLGYNAVMRYGCFGCHDIKGFEKTPGIGTELTEEGSKPLNKFDFGLLHAEHSNVGWFHEKFANTRIFDKGEVKEYLDLLRMPNYEFEEKDRDSLVTFILGLTSQKIDPPAAKKMAAWETTAEEGWRVVHKYNCQGCHMMQGLFQPAADDDPHKEEIDKQQWALEGRILTHYAEDETLGPPKILYEGQRVKTPWVHGFIHNPGSNKLRTKLTVRMPTFQMANEEVNTIVTGWAAEGKVEFPFVSEETIAMTPQERKDGELLFSKLQCLNCHTVNRVPTATEMEGGSKGLAPDLGLAYKRLHKSWIMALLRDPQKMIPGARMPGFWPDGQSPLPEILGGNAEKQIELLARYLLSLGEGKPAAASAGPRASKKKVTQRDSPKPQAE